MPKEDDRREDVPAEGQPPEDTERDVRDNAAGNLAADSEKMPPGEDLALRFEKESLRYSIGGEPALSGAMSEAADLMRQITKGSNLPPTKENYQLLQQALKERASYYGAASEPEYRSAYDLAAEMAGEVAEKSPSKPASAQQQQKNSDWAADVRQASEDARGDGNDALADELKEIADRIEENKTRLGDDQQRKIFEETLAEGEKRRGNSAVGSEEGAATWREAVQKAGELRDGTQFVSAVGDEPGTPKGDETPAAKEVKPSPDLKGLGNEYGMEVFVDGKGVPREAMIGKEIKATFTYGEDGRSLSVDYNHGNKLTGRNLEVVDHGTFKEYTGTFVGTKQDGSKYLYEGSVAIGTKGSTFAWQGETAPWLVAEGDKRSGARAVPLTAEQAARIEGTGSPAVKEGAEVRLSHETWKVTNIQEKTGLAIMEQPGRGADWAVMGTSVDAKELADPTKFQKVEHDGSTYYRRANDKTGTLYQTWGDPKPGEKAHLYPVYDKMALPVQELRPSGSQFRPVGDYEQAAFAAGEQRAKKGADYRQTEKAPAAPAPLGDSPRGTQLQVGGKVRAEGKEFTVEGIDSFERRAVLKTPGEAQYGKKVTLSAAQMASGTEYSNIVVGDKEFYADKQGNVYEPTKGQPREITQRTDLRVAKVNTDGTLRYIIPQEAPKGDVKARTGGGTAVGDVIELKGEKMQVAQQYGEHSILYQKGRGAAFAVVAQPVTAVKDGGATVTAGDHTYERIKVNVAGKEVDRYIDKANPTHGIFQLTDLGGSKSLYPDHQFVVEKTANLKGTGEVVARTGGQGGGGDKPPEKPAPPAPGDKPPPPPSDAKPAKVESKEAAMGYRGEKLAVEERTRTIDGSEVKVRTPKEGYERQFFREVEIDGKTIKLNRTGSQQWFYSEQSGPLAETQVKLHVTGVSPEDTARLQRELLPLLEEMRAKGEIGQYKTFDPNWMDSEWGKNPDKYGSQPGAKGQDSKAFTIYLDPEQVEKVSKALDARLKEKGLVLGPEVKADTVGDYTRANGASRRVSVERDMWDITRDQFGNQGALIDKPVVDKLKEKYPTGTDGKFSQATLREIEKAAGIAADQLTYDKSGRLMYADGNFRSSAQGEKLFYCSESGQNTTPGEKTGRGGIYALYDHASLDPAKMYMDGRPAPERVAGPAPERVAPTPDRVERPDTRVQGDGTVARTTMTPAEFLKQLEKQKELTKEQVTTMEADVKKLREQGLEERAKALEKVIAELNHEDPVIRRTAHERVLSRAIEDARAQVAAGHGGPKFSTRAAVGTAVGIGLLATAALGAYLLLRDKEPAPPPTPRAGVGKN